MSALQNSNYSTETCGKLKFTRQFNEIVSSTGQTIDLTDIQFEDRKGATNFVKIVNYGVRPVYVAFDSEGGHEAIDSSQQLTFNLCVDGGRPYNDIGLNGQVTKISLKCDINDETNVAVIVW